MNEKLILIVDDHRLFASGVRLLLTGSGYQNIDVLSEARTLKEYLQQRSPDLILMDITLDDADGIILSATIKQQYPSVKILIVSMHVRRVYIEKAIQAGVDGYIEKNAPDEELKIGVAALLEGGRYFSARVAQALLKSWQSSVADVALTPREKDVLRLIADGNSTKEIADQLFVSENTIEAHRKNMLFKTGLRNVAHLVKWALERGEL